MAYKCPVLQAGAAFARISPAMAQVTAERLGIYGLELGFSF